MDGQGSPRSARDRGAPVGARSGDDSPADRQGAILMRIYPEVGAKALPDPSESLDTALTPRPVMPGYVGRNEDVFLGLTLPPQFIDRCRQAYLRMAHDAAAGPRQVGVTSALYGEGKTSIALGLATAIAADTLEPTLLLECDLERASLDRRLGFKRSPGLTEWL